MARCARSLILLTVASLVVFVSVAPSGAHANEKIQLKLGPLTPDERKLVDRFWRLWTGFRLPADEAISPSHE